MLKETTVATEIYKFSVNYSIEMKKNEQGEYDYVKFLFADLLEEGFDDNDFLVAIKTIKRENPSMYGKMPNLAMFIEARPRKPYISTLPEHQIFIAERKPPQIERQLTPAETQEQERKAKEFDEKIKRKLDKLKHKVKIENKKQKKYEEDLKKMIEEHKKKQIAKLDPENIGVLSPQLKKLVKNEKKS